ncbi:MAG: hypothetical protein HQK53_19940, partial [Oligoflexia bacterium]|nr:hypothetical protein [Oligoflexia bacterium]
MLRKVIEGYFVCCHGIEKQRVAVNYNHQTDEINDWFIERVDVLSPPDVIFSEQQLFFPSFVDLHVHAREDNSALENYKEDFFSASLAAQNGGVCAFMDMPNNLGDPPVDLPSFQRKYRLIQEAMQIVRQKTGVKTVIFPYVLLNKQSRPFTFEERPLPYKLFLGALAPYSFYELETLLKNFAGESISFHCEHPNFLAKTVTTDVHMHNLYWHSQNRPVEAEVQAIADVLRLTERYNINATICHLSTARGLELCLQARARGVSVKIEVT